MVGEGSSSRLQTHLNDSDVVGTGLPHALGFLQFNRSLALLANNTQWHGDVFADPPKPRTDEDLGFAVFAGYRKGEWKILAVSVIILMLVDNLGLRRISDECSYG